MVPNCGYIETADLKLSSDNLHYITESFVEMGIRYASKMA
jgi:hypothetical protein